MCAAAHSIQQFLKSMRLLPSLHNLRVKSEIGQAPICARVCAHAHLQSFHLNGTNKDLINIIEQPYSTLTKSILLHRNHTLDSQSEKRTSKLIFLAVTQINYRF